MIPGEGAGGAHSPCLCMGSSPLQNQQGTPVGLNTQSVLIAFFTGDSWCENFEQREEISPKKEHVHGVEDEKVDFRAGETSDDFPRQEILQREENMSKRRGNSWNLPS